MSIDEIFGSIRPKGGYGCRVCGQPSRATVTAGIRLIDEYGRSGGKRGTTKTASVSLCGDHAAELYLQVKRMIEDTRGRDRA